MKTIKQILIEKKKPLTTVSPGDTALSAMELMRERDIGAVMVVDGKNWSASSPNATACIKSHRLAATRGRHWCVM